MSCIANGKQVSKSVMSYKPSYFIFDGFWQGLKGSMNINLS